MTIFRKNTYACFIKYRNCSPNQIRNIWANSLYCEVTFYMYNMPCHVKSPLGPNKAQKPKLLKLIPFTQAHLNENKKSRDQ